MYELKVKRVIDCPVLGHPVLIKYCTACEHYKGNIGPNSMIRCLADEGKEG